MDDLSFTIWKLKVAILKQHNGYLEPKIDHFEAQQPHSQLNFEFQAAILRDHLRCFFPKLLEVHSTTTPMLKCLQKSRKVDEVDDFLTCCPSGNQKNNSGTGCVTLAQRPWQLRTMRAFLPKLSAGPSSAVFCFQKGHVRFQNWFPPFFRSSRQVIMVNSIVIPAWKCSQPCCCSVSVCVHVDRADAWETQCVAVFYAREEKLPGQWVQFQSSSRIFTVLICCNMFY